MEDFIKNRIAVLKTNMTDNEIELTNYFIDNSDSMDSFRELIDEFIDAKLQNMYMTHCDLIKWLQNTVDIEYYMQQAVEEDLIDIGSYDFWKHVECAHYLKKFEEYDGYRNFNVYCIELFILEYLLQNDYDNTKETYDKVKSLLDTGIDDTPDDLVDCINELLSED